MKIGVVEQNPTVKSALQEMTNNPDDVNIMNC